MTTKQMWMVRAGRDGNAIDDFLDENLVAIGFGQASELPLGVTRAGALAKAEQVLANRKPGSRANAGNQVFRFLSEIAVGDYVCTYDPAQRRYCIGVIEAKDGKRDHGLSRWRRVSWTHHALRDALSAGSRNTLGAAITLFLVRESVAAELLALAVPIDAAPPPPSEADLVTDDSAVAPTEESIEEPSDEYDDIASKAAELIEDRLMGLDWEEMQDLFAGILRAMGYHTQVSAKGADRGVDIFASPDGLGLQAPRIFVEVKHRQGTPTGAPMLRAFLGGRQKEDRCLYVSTGGFTREARYEAERSQIPITLIDLPRLRDLLLDHYAKLDAAATALVPLQHLYWPAD